MNIVEFLRAANSKIILALLGVALILSGILLFNVYKISGLRNYISAKQAKYDQMEMAIEDAKAARANLEKHNKTLQVQIEKIHREKKAIIKQQNKIRLDIATINTNRKWTEWADKYKAKINNTK